MLVARRFGRSHPFARFTAVGFSIAIAATLVVTAQRRGSPTEAVNETPPAPVGLAEPVDAPSDPVVLEPARLAPEGASERPSFLFSSKSIVLVDPAVGDGAGRGASDGGEAPPAPQIPAEYLSSSKSLAPGRIYVPPARPPAPPQPDATGKPGTP